MKLDNTRSMNLPYRAYTYKVLHQFSNTGNSPPPLLHLPGHNIDKKICSSFATSSLLLPFVVKAGILLKQLE
jgi:hypothetical protein